MQNWSVASEGDPDLEEKAAGRTPLAAIKGAELDARVLLVEGSAIAETCVNVGCVPSKNLIRAAEPLHYPAHPACEGLAACAPTTNWQQVIQQEEDLVTTFLPGLIVWAGSGVKVD